MSYISLPLFSPIFSTLFLLRQCFSWSCCSNKKTTFQTSETPSGNFLFCRQFDVAGGERVPSVPLGWYSTLSIRNKIIIIIRRYYKVSMLFWDFFYKQQNLTTKNQNGAQKSVCISKNSEPMLLKLGEGLNNMYLCTVYQGLDFVCSSCVMSSWNKTMFNSFVTSIEFCFH